MKGRIKLLTSIARIMEIRSELIGDANEFAVDSQGDVAVLLHGACNQILFAKQAAEGRPSEKGQQALRRQTADSWGFCDALDAILAHQRSADVEAVCDIWPIQNAEKDPSAGADL
jgi:hypothetical protein